MIYDIVRCMENADSRRLKPEVEQELKKQAIRFHKMGMKQRLVTEILDVYPTNLPEWCRADKKEGANAIRALKRGRRVGPCLNLTIEQEKQIQKTIVDKRPDQVKLTFALWTRTAV